MRRSVLVVGMASIVLCASAARGAEPPTLEATTAGGDRVRLLPSGRWEYVDPKKAEVQKPIVQAYDKRHDDEKSLEQGGILGIGRKIRPGDPDYNRGSLGGKH